VNVYNEDELVKMAGDKFREVMVEEGNLVGYGDGEVKDGETRECFLTLKK
jgi:hypothetical protein